METSFDLQLRRAREEAQKAIDYAEVRRKRMGMREGLAAAALGNKHLGLRHFKEAVDAFHNFLRLLEKSRNAKQDELTPSHFDPKRELMELLLITGVYWELAKIYDHTKKPEMQRLFQLYLRKFISFAKGQPYEGVCAESLRRFIDRRASWHLADFKNAYIALGGKKVSCFVATALWDVSEPGTLDRLRRVRSEFLMKRGWGRVFVRVYYRVGPGLARASDFSPTRVRRAMGVALSWLSRILTRHVIQD